MRGARTDLDLDAPARIGVFAQTADASLQSESSIQGAGHRAIVLARQVAQAPALPQHADGLGVMGIAAFKDEFEPVPPRQGVARARRPHGV